MKIFLNASEISSLLVKNKFKKNTEVIFRIWQKYYYDDFNNIVENLKKNSILAGRISKEIRDHPVFRPKIDILGFWLFFVLFSSFSA